MIKNEQMNDPPTENYFFNKFLFIAIFYKIGKGITMNLLKK